MTPRSIRLGILLVVGALQLAVPLGMIVARERTLSEGAGWRFRTAPVDPADAFRGRYLALAFEESSAPLSEGFRPERGEWVYAPLSEGPEGFAELGPVRGEPPSEGDFLRLRVFWLETPPGEVPRAHVRLPFDRLYLEESLAPRVDEVFRDRTAGDDGLPAWATVRVRDGRAVLEDVMVAGQSVRELVERAASDGR